MAAINPLGKVPAIDDGGFTLSERLALFDSASILLLLLLMITSFFIREISPLYASFCLRVDASIISQSLVVTTMQIQPH
jgi:hypothetical protein